MNLDLLSFNNETLNKSQYTNIKIHKTRFEFEISEENSEKKKSFRNVSCVYLYGDLRKFWLSFNLILSPDIWYCFRQQSLAEFDSFSLFSVPFRFKKLQCDSMHTNLSLYCLKLFWIKKGLSDCRVERL